MASFQSRISRTPYPPIGEGARCHKGPKIQSRHHLAPQRKLRSPKLKYEALEISEPRRPFERKVLMNYSYFGPLWKQGIYTLQLPRGVSLKAKQPTYTLQSLFGPIWKQGASHITVSKRGPRHVPPLPSLNQTHHCI